MAYYSNLIDIVTILVAFMLIAGLYRPWWVLWFAYKQTRLMVIRYYGSVLALLLILGMAV